VTLLWHMTLTCRNPQITNHSSHHWRLRCSCCGCVVGMARLQLQQQCRGAQTWLHLRWKIHGELIFARQAEVPAGQAASLLQFAVKRHGNRNSAILHFAEYSTHLGYRHETGAGALEHGSTLHDGSISMSAQN